MIIEGWGERSARTFDGDEVGPTFVGDGLSQHRLAAPGRAVQKNASRYYKTQLFEPLRCEAIICEQSRACPSGG